MEGGGVPKHSKSLSGSNPYVVSLVLSQKDFREGTRDIGVDNLVSNFDVLLTGEWGGGDLLKHKIFCGVKHKIFFLMGGGGG